MSDLLLFVGSPPTNPRVLVALIIAGNTVLAVEAVDSVAHAKRVFEEFKSKLRKEVMQ